MSNRSLKGMPKVPMKGTQEWDTFVSGLERKLGRSLTRREVKQLMRIADKQTTNKGQHNWSHVDSVTKEKGYQSRPQYHERKSTPTGRVFNLANDTRERKRKRK